MGKSGDKFDRPYRRKGGDKPTYTPEQTQRYKSMWERLQKSLEIFPDAVEGDSFKFLSKRSPSGYWEVKLEQEFQQEITVSWEGEISEGCNPYGTTQPPTSNATYDYPEVTENFALCVAIRAYQRSYTDGQTAFISNIGEAWSDSVTTIEIKEVNYPASGGAVITVDEIYFSASSTNNDAPDANPGTTITSTYTFTLPSNFGDNTDSFAIPYPTVGIPKGYRIFSHVTGIPIGFVCFSFSSFISIPEESEAKDEYELLTSLGADTIDPPVQVETTERTYFVTTAFEWERWTITSRATRNYLFYGDFFGPPPDPTCSSAPPNKTNIKWQRKYKFSGEDIRDYDQITPPDKICDGDFCQTLPPDPPNPNTKDPRLDSIDDITIIEGDGFQCTCPDFSKKLDAFGDIDIRYPSLKIASNWENSNAGTDQYCKHILASMRVRGDAIPAYNDIPLISEQFDDSRPPQVTDGFPRLRTFDFEDWNINPGKSKNPRDIKRKGSSW